MANLKQTFEEKYDGPVSEKKDGYFPYVSLNGGNLKAMGVSLSLSAQNTHSPGLSASRPAPTTNGDSYMSFDIVEGTMSKKEATADKANVLFPKD